MVDVAGGGWEDAPMGYSTRWVKQRMPRAAARALYGMSMRTAGPEQRAARLAANYMRGTGRYSRRLRSYGRRMYKRRAPYRRYGGRGLYSGRGGFWSDAWAASGGLRKFLGDKARASSNPLLSGLGRAAGALGIGAYETEGGAVTNEIVDGGQGNPAPVFYTGGGEMGTITLSHKEYVADIFGPETPGIFQNITFGLNPGLPATFPWLSQLAQNYEEYTIKQLIFTFRSTVTDFVASNGQVGTIIMATQYNSNDEPFQSKQDMMEYSGAVSAKISQAVIAGVECDPAQLSGSYGKYTRAGPVPQSEDVKTYDLGTLNVATSNTPAQFNNQAVGELWVSYTVELRKPKFFVTRAQGLLTDVWAGSISPQTAPGVPLAIDQLNWAIGQQNRIGCSLQRAHPNTGTFTPGWLYLVFPQYFSGDVEVTTEANVFASQPPATPFGLYQDGSGAPGLIPIPDLWQSPNNVMPWTGGMHTNGAIGDNILTKYHWRVVSPTSAGQTTDNFILISTTPNMTAPTCLGMNVKVQMYNTGLNYAQSKHPILADIVTGEVLNWPSGGAPIPGP
jgi:hypothetical protein